MSQQHKNTAIGTRIAQQHEWRNNESSSVNDGSESGSSSGSNNSSDSNNDFLLLQLQQRLYHMGKTADETASMPFSEAAEDRNALNALVLALYQAQQYGQGVVNLSDLPQQPFDIAHLQTRFPNLFAMPSEQADSLNDESNQYDAYDATNTVGQLHAPIIYFPPFVAFRRDYQQLLETVAYLQRPMALHTPSTVACQKITWQLSNGAVLSDEQRLAAVTAASLGFCLITGGAGTGKTTTLVKALELMLLTNPHTHIVLAAPTGKAAHRLNESIGAQLDSVHNDVRVAIHDLRAQTIHRLLGIGEHSGRAFYHANNPLRCDVLVIDEASMIGGDLLASIRQAILPATRLILLGDANQLPAINATAFFNDISRLPIGYTVAFCQAVNPLLATPLPTETLSPDTSDIPLPNAICRLNISRRFAEQSLIERVANCILAYDSNGLLEVLQTQFISLHQGDYLARLATAYPSTPSALQTALEQRIVLCANRRGVFGSERVNAYLDQHCRRVLQDAANNIQPDKDTEQSLWQDRLWRERPWSEEWYQGRRIIIEQNDYRLGIYNGDIGVCVWAQHQWMIRFDNQRLIRVRDLNDEKYSLAFAISIHKSQGSEYNHVDVLLDVFDTQRPNPLIHQPLLYTAVTRAKDTLTLYADEVLLATALKTPTPSLSPLECLLS